MSKTYKRDEFGKSPPKHWKRPRRARKRAKQDQALREGKEIASTAQCFRHACGQCMQELTKEI